MLAANGLTMPAAILYTKLENFTCAAHWQVFEKAVFLRLVKNIQMQGTRNSEE